MDKRKPEDALTRRIRKFIRIEMEQEERRKEDIFRIHYIYDRRKKIHCRLTWLILLGINFSLLFYQVYERIEYYRSEPITVMTKIDSIVKMSALPRFILCSEMTTQSVNKFSDILLPDLISLTPEDSNVNISRLWELYDNEPDIEFTQTKGNVKPNIILEKVPSLNGICNSFIIGDKDDDFLQGFKAKLRVVYQVLPPVSLLIQDDGVAGSQPEIILFQGDHYHFVFNKLTQLKFVNTKRKPCVDEETHEKCLDKCKRKIFDSFNYSCRYPFESLSKMVPFCKGGESDEIYERYSKLNLMTSVNCNCTNKCTNILIFSQKYLIGNSSDWTELTFEAPIIEIFIDMVTYNEINLACDLGGLLGLYYGWSILSIIFLPVEWFQKRHKNKPSVKLRTKDLIKEKVVNVFYEEMRRKELERKNLNKHFKIHLFRYIYKGMKANVCFTFILLFITFPLLANCIYNYSFLSAISLSLNVEINKMMPTPILTVCMDSTNITLLKNEFSNLNKSNCNFNLLDLLPSDKSIKNFEELWDHSVPEVNIKGDFSESSIVAKDSGKCVRIKSPIRTSIGEFSLYLTWDRKDIFPNECDKLTDKVYFSSEDDDDDIVVETSSTNSMQTVTAFSTKYKFLNTTDKPCTDNITSIQCRENCRQSATKNLLCRLPYMTKLEKVPECTTTETAQDSHRMFVKSMDQCLCERKCSQTIYDIRIDDMNDLLNTTHFYIKQVNNKVIVIEENFSYPFTKLLADVGNVLGITVSLSIMSLILNIIDYIGTIRK